MKKKLWEIPRLKIGATTRKEDDGQDSPPPTPKSVVPPLSPKVDYELRTACALVLQDFKPSDYVYHERFGDADDDDPHLDGKTQLDYAALVELLGLDDGSDETAALLDPVNTMVAVDQGRTRAVTSDKAVPGLPHSASEKTNNQRYSDGLWKRVRGEQDDEEYSEGLWKRVRGEQAAEDERARRSTRPPPVQPRSTAHQRSASQPIKLTGEPVKADFSHQPKLERANSTNSPLSTPGSNGIDHGVLNSTAPTAAAIAPVGNLERPPVHQRTQSADTKVNVVDGDWMQRELERHKRAQEEDNAQQGLVDRYQAEAFYPSTITIGDAVLSAVRDAQAMNVTKATAPAVRVPARKPVPRASVDAPRNGDTQQGDSKTSIDLRRSLSQKRRSTPRSESRAELEFLESSRQSREQSRASPAELDTPIVIQRNTRPYNGVRAPAPSANVSRAPSRSRSITRQIREFVRRPSLSRKPSVEINRPGSRARSIDSTRSGVSAMSPDDASTSKWKSWRPFHRAQSSTTSVNDINGEGRERDAAREGKEKAKPPINLNRELPPLPSLDQWKDDDQEPEPPVPTVPKHIANVSIDTFATAQHTPPIQSRSQNDSIDSSTTSYRARDSVINETSPPSHLHPKRMSSLGAPTNPLKWQNPAEPTVDPATLPSTPDTVPELMSPSHRPGRCATDDVSKLPARTSSLSKQYPTSNVANATPRHISALHRTASTALPKRPPPPPPDNPKSASMDHTRVLGDQPQPNFSRKMSTDYSREDVAAANYQHHAGTAVPTTPVKDERKKRWWRGWRKGKGSRSEVSAY